MNLSIVYAVGDAATGNTDSQHLADITASTRPDAFLMLGDVYESGTAQEFQANYQPSWGQLDDVVYPVPGNHDWPNYDTGYKPYFDTAGRPSAPNYAILVGGYAVFMLNSEDVASAVRYLQDRSVLQPGRRNIACWHRPRYCSGSHGDATDTDPLWQILAPHCVLILGGHAHNAQVFKPDPTGCVQVVSGAGGRGLYAEIPNDERLAWGEASGYAVARLVLTDEGVALSFTDETTAVLWSGTFSTS